MNRIAELEAEIEEKRQQQRRLEQAAWSADSFSEAEALDQAFDDLSDEIGPLLRELEELQGYAELHENALDRAWGRSL